MNEYQVAAYEKLSAELEIPILAPEIAAGSLYTRAEWVRREASDMSRIDVLRGGVTGCLKTAALCEAFGVRLEIHMAGFGNLQVLGATSEDTCRYYERGLLAPGDRLRDPGTVPGRRSATRSIRTATCAFRSIRAWATGSTGTTSTSTASTATASRRERARRRATAPPPLPEGKVDPQVLAPLLPSRRRPPESGVLIGPAVGEDAAVVTGAERLVLTSDPITLAGSAVGRYAVAVNCNDLVAMGAEPRYLTTSILLPPGTDRAILEGLFAELHAAAAGAGVAWVGGHTEVTGAVVSPVVVGAAVGALHGNPWSSAGARVGDALVLTKWVALEGSTLLARERPDARAILGADHAAVARWLDRPGISVVAEGRVLRRFAIHAAHDPTEGGVAQGIHELACCSGVAIEIAAASLPVKPATRALCDALRIDPLGLLASGALLFTAPPEVAQRRHAGAARGRYRGDGHRSGARRNRCHPVPWRSPRSPAILPAG